jgi:hypothetical protein
MSSIPCFYVATGRYGDITPQTDGGKIFMLFYMLVSTVLVAGILGEFIDLYVCDIVGEGIIEQIMSVVISVFCAPNPNALNASYFARHKS